MVAENISDCISARDIWIGGSIFLCHTCKNKSWLFEYWLGGYYTSSFTVVEFFWLNGIFDVPASDGISDLG